MYYGYYVFYRETLKKSYENNKINNDICYVGTYFMCTVAVRYVSCRLLCGF